MKPGNLITNQRGAFRNLTDGEKVPAGWVKVELNEEVKEVKKVEEAKVETPEKVSKKDLIAKLDEIGIPHDARNSQADLQALLDDYIAANQ